MIAWTIFLSLFFDANAGAPDCSQMFVDRPQGIATAPAIGDIANEATIGVIDYLRYLVENTKALTPERLVKFRENLIAGSLYNPISVDTRSHSSDKHIYYTQLQLWIANPDIDWLPVAHWISDYLKIHHDHYQQRTEVTEDAKVTARPLEFALIPHGTYTQNHIFKRRIFFWRKRKVPVMVHLTNDFLVSTTPVTQSQWVEVMGSNPSFYSEGPFSTELDVNGTRVRLQPDNPVESISYWSSLVYLNRLSELHGFKPAYDLNHIIFFELPYKDIWNINRQQTFIYRDNPDRAFQLAATGILFSAGTNKSDLLPGLNSYDGTIYNTEGFRLPTSYEHEYLHSHLGMHENKIYFDLNSPEALEHAWPQDISVFTTRPVALLRGLKVGSTVELYDLIGHVAEMSDNNHLELEEEATDPIVINRSFLMIQREGIQTFFRQVSTMGGFNTAARPPTLHKGVESNNRLEFVGFRIARTIDPSKKDTGK